MTLTFTQGSQFASQPSERTDNATIEWSDCAIQLCITTIINRDNSNISVNIYAINNVIQTWQNANLVDLCMTNIYAHVRFDDVDLDFDQ